MKTFFRTLTRPGPSLLFWLFVYAVCKLLSTYFPEPSTLTIIGLCFLVLILSIVCGVIEAIVSTWSSK